MAFPPAHLLVGAGIGELARGGRPLPRLWAWGVGGFFAFLPDLDTAVSFALGRAAEYHGVFTHNLAATLLVALLVWAVAGPRWALLAGTAYASHLLVDVLEAQETTNVRLAWPLSDARMPSLVPLFPSVPFERGKGAFSAALSLYGPRPLQRVLEQTLIGAGFFLTALAFTAIRRRAARPAR